MTNQRTNPGDARRRGIVLLYTLSVLMIVLSLGFAYTQASFSMARGLGSAAFQQMAYQAALSGQAYGMSYIQQMVDSRNHNVPRFPIENGCGVGTNGIDGMEWWAGRERCPQSQCGVGGEAYPRVGAGGCSRGGAPMPGVETWFHYSDVVAPGTNVERYRLWFRLQMNESLTRNGYFYSDEQNSIFPCGSAPNDGYLNTLPLANQCDSTSLGMMMGPFVPCGPCLATPGNNMAPYPASNSIQYILTAIGVVEAQSVDTGNFAPVAWSQVDAPFRLKVGGYLDGAPGTVCRAIIPDTRPNRAGMYRRNADWESFQTVSRNPTQDYAHAQPYLYLQELMIEAVKDAADRPRASAPTSAVRPPAP